MKTNILKKPLLYISIFFLSFQVSIAQNITSDIDALIAKKYSKDGPGISLLIAKNGKAIYQNQNGLANIELQVPINENSVFEVGSITKQFTAVCILMLEEQGKLSINDEITKYIPDYPTNGQTITIHHLLNHTSGIKSYTSMPSFRKQDRIDLTPSELIDVFKNEPMDFNPGESYRYNNSGYVLLGHIIEVISKQSYADFLQENIFTPLKMNASYYGSMKKIIPNRASGYSPNSEGMANANYLSLTLPYAAGSIMSTTGDLLIWQNAMSANKLISNAIYEKATNGSILNNGEDINYGYGWMKGDISGSRTIEHSGGIYGYQSNGIYFPDEDIYVIGLTNFNGSDVGNFTNEVAAIAIGKPFYSEKDGISLTEKQLQKWVGTYQFDENVVRYISVKNGKIYSQREGSDQMQIIPFSENTFGFLGSRTSYEFSIKDGKKQALFKGRTSSIGKEIDKAPPTEKKEIALSEDALKKFLGTYEIQPGFAITVLLENGKLLGQATGQPKFELTPYAENAFLVKAVKAELVFDRDEQGVATGLTLHQNGAKVPGKKVK